ARGRCRHGLGQADAHQRGDRPRGRLRERPYRQSQSAKRPSQEAKRLSERNAQIANYLGKQHTWARQAAGLAGVRLEEGHTMAASRRKAKKTAKARTTKAGAKSARGVAKAAAKRKASRSSTKKFVALRTAKAAPRKSAKRTNGAQRKAGNGMPSPSKLPWGQAGKALDGVRI